MTKPIRHVTLAAAAACAIALSTAEAQNSGFNHGDLILGFQTTGSGSNNYVLANLGQAGTIRDLSSNTTLVTGLGALNNALNVQFGIGWFDRTDLYMGLFTVGSNDEFSGYFVNGDPYNTLYLGAPRQALGSAGNPQSAGFSLTANSVQEAANGMFGAANIFETQGSGAVSTLGTGLSFVDYDDQNPISAGVQGAAWGGVFAGGVQAVFGAGTFGTLGGVNAEAALDLYRIQGVNNEPGQHGFGQPTGIGTFEGTVAIDSTGQVSLVVPEPSAVGLCGIGILLAGFVGRRRPLTA